MINQTEQPMLFYEKISRSIMNKLPINEEEEKIKYLKCKLGIETLVVDSIKAIVVYSLALLFNMFFEVLIFQMGYVLVRFCGYGAHSKTNMLCTFTSIIIFLGIPYLISSGMMFPKVVLMSMIFVNYLIIFKYAPSTTQKNPINDIAKRSLLKKKAMLLNTVVLIVFVVNQNEVNINYFVIGSFLASLFMLPIAHRIIR